MTRFRALSMLLLCALLVPAASFAGISFWGYTGIAGPDGNRLSEVTAGGIPTNVASVDFAEVWTSTNLSAINTSFRAAGVKSALFLDNVLFKQFSVASNCVDANGPFLWRLRGNWQDRLANFAATNGAYINSTTTLFIVVQSEVNNRCVPLGDIQLAASAVKSYFPGIPTVMGYGRSPGAQPAPASIPSAIDWVGLFKYGTFEPSNPNNPNNADNQFLVEFNSLLGKLSSNQRVILVPDGFWATFLHAHLNSQNGPGTGWPKWYLQYLALNYESFALSQPKVVGMIVFAWPSALPDITGTKDLPQAVRDRHREIGCRNLGRCM